MTSRRSERIFVWFWSAVLLAVILAFAVYFLSSASSAPARRARDLLT